MMTFHPPRSCPSGVIGPPVSGVYPLSLCLLCLLVFLGAQLDQVSCSPGVPDSGRSSGDSPGGTGVGDAPTVPEESEPQYYPSLGGIQV